MSIHSPNGNLTQANSAAPKQLHNQNEARSLDANKSGRDQVDQDGAFTPARILQLQRTLGNQAVMQFLHKQSMDRPSKAPVIQRAKIEDLAEYLGLIETELKTSSYLENCAAGYIAALKSIDIKESEGAAEILKLVPSWKTVEISETLTQLILKFPAHYVPTNVKVWKDLFVRMGTKSGKLTAPDKGRVDLSFQEEPSAEVGGKRTEIMSGAGKRVSAAATEAMSSKAAELAARIMKAKITVNFPLDNLFNHISPQILNSFEVKEKYKIESGNTAGSLEDDRIQAEQKLFGIAKGAPARIRPRYAALNFNEHPTGAAARNDYGLSYMILADHLKENCTMTLGDSFNAPTAEDWGGAVKYGSVFPFTEAGIMALAKTVFALKGMGISEMDSIINTGSYKPSDNYLEVQIHQDLDMRQDAEEINISKLEMEMFGVNLETVSKLIENLTNSSFELV
ncbi:MAG: hypothetical protein JWM44_943 [Bacilli bacterium]|nr:hypothetical protein [Bacilli bacterium]